MKGSDASQAPAQNESEKISQKLSTLLLDRLNAIEWYSHRYIVREADSDFVGGDTIDLALRTGPEG
jgi:hypothetical protein